MKQYPYTTILLALLWILLAFAPTFVSQEHGSYLAFVKMLLVNEDDAFHWLTRVVLLLPIIALVVTTVGFVVLLIRFDHEHYKEGLEYVERAWSYMRKHHAEELKEKLEYQLTLCASLVALGAFSVNHFVIARYLGFESFTPVEYVVLFCAFFLPMTLTGDAEFGLAGRMKHSALGWGGCLFFGVDFFAIFIVPLRYVLVLFIAQILSVRQYSWEKGDDIKWTTRRILFRILIFIPLAFVILRYGSSIGPPVKWNPHVQFYHYMGLFVTWISKTSDALLWLIFAVPVAAMMIAYWFILQLEPKESK